MTVFRTLLTNSRWLPIKKSVGLSSLSCKCSFTRNRSDVPRKFVTFDEVVAQRRAEARRSIVVQVNSEASFTELYGYCSKYASINGVHHYKNSSGEHFMLIEFSTEANLKEVIRTCSTHQKDIDVMALKSPFLWFRANTNKKEKYTIPDELSLVTKHGDTIENEDQLIQELAQCVTVSQQIQLLYDRTALNDLGIRLRYMVARQIECIFESFYTNIAVHPFGSSVNGFGKLGCDLDLVLTNTLTDEVDDGSRRLVFQEKKRSGSPREWARHLEAVGDALELRAAGVARVQRILHARVPILKATHHFAGLDCDLCFNNMSGVHMSRLMWQLVALGGGTAALGGAVRRWARAAGLTAPHPGRWITNFPLTLMVIFFLQQPSKDGFVLPSIKTLLRKAGNEDATAEENADCTFICDLNKLPTTCYGQSNASLETLLLQFFEFYAQFDFQNKAISINEGTTIRKPNNNPLYIVNPLDQTLNVSRNVSYEECERFKAEVRNAAWQLESTEKNKTDDWGIIGLIEGKTTRGLKKLLSVGNSHRLVSVKDLFEDEDTPEASKSKSQRLKQKSESSDKESDTNGSDMKKKLSKFKNTHVAAEVHRIRRNKMV